MKITEQITNDLSLLSPETGTIFIIVALILLELFLKDKKYVHLAFIGSLFGILYLNIDQILFLEQAPKSFVFSNHIIISAKTSYIKCLLTFVVILYCIYKECKNIKDDNHSELSISIITQLLGSFIVIQAGSYLTLFLGVEIVSVTSYIIAFYGKDNQAKISAMKYFLFGAFSSALMIYGVSWMYGLTGDYLINDISVPHTHQVDVAFYYLAVICIYSGLLFKISAIPFHLWTPDVYKGLPNSILAIISLLPKISGLVAVYNLHKHLSHLENFGTISYNYLFLVSIITMLMGNFIALKQTNFKALYAFSSIAQTGLMLAFIPSQNLDLLVFYITFYIFMNFSLLFTYETLARNDHETEISFLSGKGLRHPLISVLLTISVVSLIGIPPFVGFIGKVLISKSLLEHGFEFKNVQSLAAVVIIFTTFISLVYYLKIPYYLFVKKYEDSNSFIFYRKQIYFSAILILPLVVGFFSFDWLLYWLQQVK